MTLDKIRALEFYSGIGAFPNITLVSSPMTGFSGGFHLALERSHVPGTIVRAFDWDQAACHVYSANYGSNISKKVSVQMT
jgi:tRNA (cytosine38-C5)-methyltransferase